MDTTVLITGNIPAGWQAALNGHSLVTTWEGEEYLMPRKRLLACIEKYDALINFAEVKVDQELVQKGRRLKVIANCSIGYDNFNLPLLTANRIWATNSPGFFNEPVAEYVLTTIISLLRRLPEAEEFVRNGRWESFEPGRWDGDSLFEKTVGIIGMGSVGKALRKLLIALNVKVIYNSTSHGTEPGWVSFEELISCSDIISVHVPLTDQTRNLVNSVTISHIKRGAILVNTSRGAIVDQDALIRALQTGKLGGAILDVFRDEPSVPPALFQMKNVLLTPHIAGGTRTARELCVKNAIYNVCSVFNNERPLNALNEIV